MNFYQRSLAKATKDAYRLAKRMATETSAPETMDRLLIPALGLMVVDQNLQAINQTVADRVIQDIGGVVTRLAPAESSSQPSAAGPVAILGVPAESAADALLLDMLHVTLVRSSLGMKRLPVRAREELLTQIATERPAVVCIAALPPSGNANARFLCRKIRASLPHAFILVLSPVAEGKGSPEAAARLREAGANDVVDGVREAARLLAARRGSPLVDPELVGPMAAPV